MKTKIFLFLALVSVLSLPTYGATITLTSAQLTGFSFNLAASSASAVQGSVLATGNGAAFSVDWHDSDPKIGVFDSALGLNIGNTGSDVFELDIMNSNLNPWTWTVELFDSANVLIGMGSVTPLVGNTSRVSVALNGTTIDHIRLTVTGVNPGDTNGDANIFPAPEPASLLLLGTGLLALPLWRKLRR